MNEVYNYLENEMKINPNDVIVIGNSSGPDSMALCYILQELRKKYNFKIINAHVNHNLRKQSKEEAKFLKDYCEKNDIVFEYMKIEKYGNDNFHNEARKIRYNFFESIVKKYNAKYLMTAHHADDLIETIMMRIVRGSSLRGYAGFSREVIKNNYKIIRPLITVTKKQIEDFNKEKSIKYYVDKSNFKTKYTRNRYRKTLLPFLKQEDPNVHQKFIKFSKLLFDVDSYINKEVNNVYNDVCNNNELNITKFNRLDDLFKYKLLYQFLEKYYVDDEFFINDTHIKLINDLISSNKKNTSVNIPNNLIIVKEYDKLYIKNKIDEVCSYEIEFNGYAELPNNHIIEEVEISDSNDNNICRISKEDVLLPLYIRTRKDGDRMFLKKVNGSKKIKDIFIDNKISAKKRETWPIVIDSSGNIIWIPGIKKSKFTKTKSEKCDIILKYH